MLHVRDLGLEEGASISRLMRDTRDPTVMRRCQVVLPSNQGFSPPKIAKMVWWSEDWVRRVIKDFNRAGRDALFPQRVGGRPPTFTPELRRAMVDVALSNPRDRGYTGPWTLDRLRLVVVMEGIVESISKERLREILHEEAISFQAGKTWKESKDPRFKEKVRRLRALTHRPHNPPSWWRWMRWVRSSSSRTAATVGLVKGTPIGYGRPIGDSMGFATSWGCTTTTIERSGGTCHAASAARTGCGSCGT